MSLLLLSLRGILTFLLNLLKVWSSNSNQIHALLRSQHCSTMNASLLFTTSICLDLSCLQCPQVLTYYIAELASTPQVPLGAILNIINLHLDAWSISILQDSNPKLVFINILFPSQMKSFASSCFLSCPRTIFIEDAYEDTPLLQASPSTTRNSLGQVT